MKIKENAMFVREEILRVWPTEPAWSIATLLKKCGQPIIFIGKKDHEKGLVYCKFTDGEAYWFPASCIEGYEPEEPMQILPEGTMVTIKTLRDEFAMAAMESLLLSWLDEVAKIDEAKLAEMSYKISDAMMEARKK